LCIFIEHPVYECTMEGVCATAVRADLVCHADNSAHNTLAAPAVAAAACYLVQRVVHGVVS